MNDLPEEQFHQQLNTKSAFMPSDARFLLYGLDNTPQVVAVEPSGTHEVTIYRRDEHRHTVSERRANTPWIISRTPQPYNDEADTDIIPLRGDHPFRYLITFASRASYNRAAERSRNSPNSVIGPFSLTGQFQIRTGLTMFKTMEFQDLRRMQLDLETLSLDPGTDDAGIIMIAIRQDSFETVLVHESTEAELLNRLSDIVAKLDPDVIEGHNILGFDVPYLIHRANHAGVELKLGRDGSAPRLLEGGRQPRVFIHGRHVIDTYQQIQRFDVAGRFSRYGLKEVIRQLGLERQDRTLVDRTRIVEIWRSGEHDRQVLADYALDDVRDVDTLSRIVMPTEFYQTQMLPVSYQRSSSIGTGRKIDELMLRSYLAAGHSIPSPSPSRPYPGGYVELIQTGAFGPVVKCDVESLYPSIMLRDAITSANDVLHAFPILLRDLTERRLDAKRRVLETSGEERETWHSLQASFKILINSFYGYLGFGVGAFNDFDAAERVTIEGQRLIQRIVEHLREFGAKPIEVDTDGVYFAPPPEVTSETEEKRFIHQISERLPSGIRLAHDGRFRHILSLRIKTYALIDYNGTLTLTGSALRSRALERCFQAFILAAAEGFMTADIDAVRDRYFRLASSIQAKDLPVQDISQWTMLRQDKIASRTRLKKLLDANPGEWRYGERVEVYEREDGELGLVRNYDNDENTTALLKRLRDVAERFGAIFEDRAAFDAAFPLIRPTTDIAAARQQKPTRQLGLFP